MLQQVNICMLILQYVAYFSELCVLVQVEVINVCAIKGRLPF